MSASSGAGRRGTIVRVADDGQLTLPTELVERLGLVAGATVRIDERGEGVAIGRSTANLARVYIEPTNLCNLHCRTCVRNVWDEPPGRMSAATFARVIDGVTTVSPRPTVFFGGFGEPFAHPDLLGMIATAKATGSDVELITNGTALDEATSTELVRLGLDRLWVSIDGASPESYADVRLHDALPQVTESLVRLARLREMNRHVLPRIGIAFVAMKRNVADLPEVVRMAGRVGADRISVSNVLPHTPEMREQVLYGETISVGLTPASPWAPEVLLPRMSWRNPDVAGLAGLRERSAPLGRVEGWDDPSGICPFVERGSISVRWDGEVSPCLPLLHTHLGYLDFRPRTSQAYSIGNVNARSLLELWGDPAYVELRERLQAFDFAPCTICNSCDMADENLEDCFGNSVPACGGCLWAQGFIRCP